MSHLIVLSPVHIHRIGDGLKGVERDANWQKDLAYIEIGASKLVGPYSQVVYHFKVQVKEGVHRIHKEIGILKVGEHKEVNHNAHHHSEFFPSPLLGYMDQLTQVVIRKGGEDQDEEEESGCFPVEKETGGK